MTRGPESSRRCAATAEQLCLALPAVGRVSGVVSMAEVRVPRSDVNFSLCDRMEEVAGPRSDCADET